MAIEHFRSAFRGFNRMDVVRYIEYLTQQHSVQISQLQNQLKTAQDTNQCESLRQQLDAANARIAELEQALENHSVTSTSAAEELEAYRRAERAERVAQEKADQIFSRANAVLADATLKAAEASDGLTGAADQISSQLAAYQESIQAARNSLQEAVEALYSIRPQE